jgi:FKBP-type peptidyl-prolyl cis-trans isomerase 2
MTLKKKDFIEIEFTGKIKDGEIFDSNIKEDVKKTDANFEPKPFIFSLGEGMFLKGVDEFLIGKEIKEYEIELPPEKAFGDRQKSLIQLIPMRVFKQQKINPQPGIVFNFDGRIAKILSVSGGRVIADFNNPISGKTVVYKVKVLRKINDLDEKIKSFISFLFKRDLKFEIKDKKVIIEVEEKMVKFIELFGEKFKDVLGMDLEVKGIDEKKEANKESK